MIILDTNILCRYFLKNDEKLYKDALEILNKETSFMLLDAVFCEVIFVLLSQGVTKGDLIDKLPKFLDSGRVVVSTEMDYAFNIYQKYNLHIVDCLIVAKAIVSKLELASFDRKMINIWKKENRVVE